MLNYCGGEKRWLLNLLPIILPLLVLKTINLILEYGLKTHFCDDNFLLLAKSVASVKTLVFSSRIPGLTRTPVTLSSPSLFCISPLTYYSPFSDCFQMPVLQAYWGIPSTSLITMSQSPLVITFHCFWSAPNVSTC